MSGRRRDITAAALRFLLRLAETPYSLAVRFRNRRFDRGVDVHRVDAPVISVGNLTLGGTGKTPMVEWIARWFRARGVRVVLVSRGYGSKSGKANDEALELAQKLPDVPHLQDPDRVKSAQYAIRERGSELILLDDGFQHRRLARDLDVVLVDATEPFGFGHVFPRGTLREPLSGWSRAHAIVLTRADMLTADERGALRSQIMPRAPQAIWVEVTHAPRVLLDASATEQPLDTLAGKRVAAFCGIGNPAGFEHALKSCGYEVVALREFPDHHAYTSDDLASLASWVASLNVSAVLCTHKDLVKVNSHRLGEISVFALAIGLNFIAGQDQFEALLQPLLPVRR